MKIRLHRKCLSEKALVIHDYPTQGSISNRDPFQNMKATKKTNPILKPICHRRTISDEISPKYSSYESQKRGIKESPSINWLLLSPKATLGRYPALNPIFHVNKRKERLLNIDILSSIKVPDQEGSCGGIIVDKGWNMTCEKKNNKEAYCVTNKRVIKRVTNLIMSQKSKSDRKELEFSFGKN